MFHLKQKTLLLAVFIVAGSAAGLFIHCNDTASATHIFADNVTSAQAVIYKETRQIDKIQQIGETSDFSPAPTAALSITTTSKQQQSLDITEYYHMTGEELLRKLQQLPEQSEPSATSIILKLLQTGILSPNTPLYSDQQGTEYTPLLTALISDPNINADKITHFLELGSYVTTEDSWLAAISNIRDTEAAILLVEQTGFDPEHANELIHSALVSGNQELYQYINQSAEISMSPELTAKLQHSAVTIADEAIAHFDRALTDNYRSEKSDLANDKKWLIDNLFRLNSLLDNAFISTEEREELVIKIRQTEQLLTRLEQY